MTNPNDNHGEQPSPARREGLAANWPLLVVAVLGLLALIVMPRLDQDRVRKGARQLVPGLPAKSSQPSDTGVDTGGYQARYEAEKAIREALHERLYGRKYQRYTEIEAEVLKRNPYEGYYTGDLLLSQGSNQGVRVGMAVVGRDWVLVGRVTAVDKTTCTLRLVTHPDLRLSVRIPSRDLSGLTAAVGTVSTKGQLALQLPPPALFVSAIQPDELAGTPRTQDQRDPYYLKPDDAVVTNGQSDPDNFADGILVGRISYTMPPETNNSNWPMKAWVIPARLDNLRYVKIIVPPPRPAAVAKPPSTH